MKKIITIALSIALIFGCMLPAQGAKAYTGTYSPAKFKKNVTLYANQTYEFDLGKKMRRATNLKVTSNNHNVLVNYGSTPSYMPYDKTFPGYIFVKAKNRGSAKLNIQLTYKGKKYKYSAKVKVVKYKNPVSKLKIGNTNYASNLNENYDYYGLNTFNQRVKLQVKPKKGWKVTEIEFARYHDKSLKPVKNNSYVTFGSDGGYVVVTLYNKKLNQCIRLWTVCRND